MTTVCGLDLHRRQITSDGPHVWQLGVSGDLDASTADQFNAAPEEVVSGGGRLIVLDLNATTFLDSTGLRCTVRPSRLLAERDVRLAVTSLAGAAHRVLELTGLLERLRDRAHRATTGRRLTPASHGASLTCPQRQEPAAR